VELSRGDHEEGTCGLLKAMYGTRDASQNWELACAEIMTEVSCKQVSYSACMLYRKEKNVGAVAHGDDSTALGDSRSLDWFREVVRRRMEAKFKGRLEGEREREVSQER
jgi:hypothetical protein